MNDSASGKQILCFVNLVKSNIKYACNKILKKAVWRVL